MNQDNFRAEQAAVTSQATRQAFAAMQEHSRPLMSKCRRCGYQDFPASSVCAACLGLELDGIEISATGVLYSFTSLQVKGIRTFVGYVDHAEGLRCFGEIDTENGRPRCGQTVELKLQRVPDPSIREPKLVYGLATRGHE